MFGRRKRTLAGMQANFWWADQSVFQSSIGPATGIVVVQIRAEFDSTRLVERKKDGNGAKERSRVEGETVGLISMLADCAKHILLPHSIRMPVYAPHLASSSPSSALCCLLLLLLMPTTMTRRRCSCRRCNATREYRLRTNVIGEGRRATSVLSDIYRAI